MTCINEVFLNGVEGGRKDGRIQKERRQEANEHPFRSKDVEDGKKDACRGWIEGRYDVTKGTKEVVVVVVGGGWQLTLAHLEGGVVVVGGGGS